jgi:hypothetical protein
VYLEGEEGKCKWCSNWGPVDQECENCPEGSSIYLPLNEIGHPPVPTVYVQNYLMNIRVLERLKMTTPETELQVFWELVQEFSFRRFMDESYGEVNPEYTTGSYVRDRLDKCEYCRLKTVPELMSRLGFFLDVRFYNQNYILVETTPLNGQLYKILVQCG